MVIVRIELTCKDVSLVRPTLEQVMTQLDQITEKCREGGLPVDYEASYEGAVPEKHDLGDLMERTKNLSKEERLEAVNWIREKYGLDVSRWMKKVCNGEPLVEGDDVFPLVVTQAFFDIHEDDQDRVIVSSSPLAEPEL